MFKAFLILCAAAAAFTYVLCCCFDTATAADLPVKEEGRLIVFQSSSMRCALYVNEGGTTHGTSSMACVDLPWDESIDNSIKILDIRKTVESD